MELWAAVSQCKVTLQGSNLHGDDLLIFDYLPMHWAVTQLPSGLIAEFIVQCMILLLLAAMSCF